MGLGALARSHAVTETQGKDVLCSHRISTTLSPSELCLRSPQHPHIAPSSVSLPSLDLGGFPHHLAYICLAAVKQAGSEISLYPPLLGLKHLFFPPKRTLALSSLPVSGHFLTRSHLP